MAIGGVQVSLVLPAVVSLALAAGGFSCCPSPEVRVRPPNAAGRSVTRSAASSTSSPCASPAAPASNQRSSDSAPAGDGLGVHRAPPGARRSPAHGRTAVGRSRPTRHRARHHRTQRARRAASLWPATKAPGSGPRSPPRPRRSGSAASPTPRAPPNPPANACRSRSCCSWSASSSSSATRPSPKSSPACTDRHRSPTRKRTMNELTYIHVPDGSAPRSRMRQLRDDDRGEVTEKVIIVAIFAALAIAVGAIIVTKVTAKANSITTEYRPWRPTIHRELTTRRRHHRDGPRRTGAAAAHHAHHPVRALVPRQPHRACRSTRRRHGPPACMTAPPRPAEQRAEAFMADAAPTLVHSVDRHRLTRP